MLIIVFCGLKAYGQNTGNKSWNYKNFESKFLVYEPSKKEGVSDKDFSFGQMVVSETKKSIDNNSENFNHSDYWNITTALYSLNEEKEIWEIPLKKLAETRGGCEYLISFKERARFYEESKELYESLIKNCESQLKEEKVFDLSKYVKENLLDLGLVSLIKKIGEDDQKYRDLNKIERQHQLDSRNQILIDSLFKKHKTYIGKTLVGEKYNVVMWAVIQHSNLEMMERYLPVVQKAVEEKEIHQTPFKMLIDRIYWFREGYQIFGSQAGVDLADEKKRMEVAKKYKIE